MYGVYSAVSKRFVFGIEEETKQGAMSKLGEKIGNDARKWRFSARELPKETTQALKPKLHGGAWR